MTPVFTPDAARNEPARAFALSWARSRGLIAPGDHIVVVHGSMPNHPSHNGMFVEVVE